MNKQLSILALLVLFLLPITAYSADSATKDTLVSIKGNVVDEKNKPIIGAVVQLSANNMPNGGAATDESGRYQINIPERILDLNLRLRISYTSYKPQTIQLDSTILSKDLTSVLQIDKTNLGDVEVICYPVPKIKPKKMPKKKSVEKPIQIDRFEPNKTVFTRDQIEKGAY